MVIWGNITDLSCCQRINERKTRSVWMKFFSQLCTWLVSWEADACQTALFISNKTIEKPNGPKSNCRAFGMQLVRKWNRAFVPVKQISSGRSSLCSGCNHLHKRKCSWPFPSEVHSFVTHREESKQNWCDLEITNDCDISFHCVIRCKLAIRICLLASPV